MIFPGGFFFFFFSKIYARFRAIEGCLHHDRGHPDDGGLWESDVRFNTVFEQTVQGNKMVSNS